MNGNPNNNYQNNFNNHNDGFYYNDQQYNSNSNFNFDEDCKRKDQIDGYAQKCMILGIVSIVCIFFCPCIPAFILSIISLVFYSKGKKLSNGEKLQSQFIVGQVCSIISLVISILYFILIVFCLVYTLFVIAVPNLFFPYGL